MQAPAQKLNARFESYLLRKGGVMPVTGPDFMDGPLSAKRERAIALEKYLRRILGYLETGNVKNAKIVVEQMLGILHWAVKEDPENR